MDGLQQVLKLFEENERQLDMFLASTNPEAAMEDVDLEHSQAMAAYNRNAIINHNGSFVATSSTYRSRAAA